MTKQFICYLSIVVTCLTLLVSLTNGVALPSQSSGTVPSHLSKSRLLYRGIYKTTIQSLGETYAKGKSPTDYSKDSGDFSPEGTGAFYVFDNEQQARAWGHCHTDGTVVKTYVVATYQYTPQTHLKMKSFTSADANWLNFVESNYASTTKNSPYDIVEGPISASGRDQHGKKIKVGYANNGQLVWQGAFITPAALNTLVMTDIKQYSVSDKHSSYACIVQ